MLMDTDERLILMDLPLVDGSMMGEDDLRALYNAGIHTAQMCYMEWHKVEPREGLYVWGEFDRRVEVLNRVGFKVLIMCYREPAQYFPIEYYAHTNTGSVERGALSLWNPVAQGASLEYLASVRDHYSSEQNLVINAQLAMGETAYLNVPAFYDPAATLSFQMRWNTEELPMPDTERTTIWLLESLIKVLVDQNRVLAINPYHREIWSMLHPEIALQGFFIGNGCSWIEDIYTAYVEEIPGVEMGQIWYTAIQHGRVHPRMDQLIKTFGLHAFGGAEYCEGLSQTVPFAKTHNFQGLLIAPLHPFTGHLRVEPWMVQAIEKALLEFSVV